MADKKIKITQIASAEHRGKSQLATVRALGLGRINKISELKDTPEIRGMIKKVAHLVKVEG